MIGTPIKECRFNTVTSTVAMMLLAATVVCSGCMQRKIIKTEVYRPVDYMTAEREAIMAELDAVLDDRLTPMQRSLERLDEQNNARVTALKNLEDQYTALEAQYKDLQSTVTHLKKELDEKNDAPLNPKPSTSSQEKKNEGTFVPLSPEDPMRANGTQSASPSNETNDTKTQAGDVEPLYAKGRALLLENDPEKAEQLFKTIYQNHPRHALAVNALYWAGECRYSLRDYEGAIAIFKKLIETYPKGSKVPDALLKTAYAYLSMDDPDRAHHYLKSVVTTYPFSPAGEKAAEKLKAYQ